MSIEAQPTGPAPPAAKILVVDDTPANLVAMRLLLRGTGAQLVEVASGNAALAATLDHDFALILLDVQMSDIDGFEVAALLSDDERTRDTPIIFVTAAYRDDLNRLKGYRHGAVDYIAKPVNDVILLSKVRVFLDLYHGKRTLKDLLAQLKQRNAELQAEVAERKRLEELARHQAGHDALTRLPNRLLFMDRIDQAVRRAQRQRKGFSLLYIDLDGFKPVNDRYGHPAGDRALQVVASRLQNVVRHSDTCARIGGDEFAVIMDGAESDDAQRLGEQICRALREPFCVNPDSGDGPMAQLGASIGIACFPESAAEGAEPLVLIEGLIHAADEAMYIAKRAGKNRCHVARGSGLLQAGG